MMNNVFLIGKLKTLIEDNTFTIEVTDYQFANEDKKEEKFEVECKCFGSIGESVNKYCKIGSIVGIKGKLNKIDDKLTVVVEKITFLSSREEGEENENQ